MAEMLIARPGRVTLIVLAGLAAVFVLAGANSASAISPNEEVVVGVPSVQQEVLDPTLVAGNGKVYSGQTTDWLIGLDPNGKLSKETGILSDWSTSDGQTYAFTVRRGIRWQDGKPLTAYDVSFTFKMMKRVKAVCLSCGVVKKEVQAVPVTGPYKMRVVLTAPDFNFINAMSPIDGDFKVIPQHYFHKYGSAAYAQTGIGSGPWIFQNRQIGQYAVFQRNARYWRKSAIPKFKFLKLVFISDSATCLNRLRTKEVDMCALGLDQLNAATSSGIKIRGLPNVANHGMIFPFSDDPGSWTHKTQFRKALSLAIDTNAIVKRFYPSSIGSPQNTQTALLFSQSTLGFDPKLPKYKYDPAQARSILRSLNYDGTPIDLWSFVLGAATELPSINEVIAQMWTEVGLKVNIIPIDFGSFFAKLTSNPIKMDRSHIQAAIETPRTRPGVLGNITTWMLPKSAGGVTGVYWNPTFIVGEYNKLKQIADQQVLDRELAKLNKKLHEEYWAIPLNLRNQTYGLGPKIGSWTPIKGNPSELNFGSLGPK